jgi:hypothetical protein
MPLRRPLAARSPGDPPARGIGDGCTRLHGSYGLAGGRGSLARTPPSLWGDEASPSHFSGSQALPRAGEAPLLGGRACEWGAALVQRARGPPNPGGRGRLYQAWFRQRLAWFRSLGCLWVGWRFGGGGLLLVKWVLR